jgi:hypothetical protein
MLAPATLPRNIERHAYYFDQPAVHQGDPLRHPLDPEEAAHAVGAPKGGRGRAEVVTVPPLQYWFTGGALGAFLALVATASTLGYSWYRAAVTEQDAAGNKLESASQKAKSEHVKDQLGKAIAEANAMLQKLNDQELDQATKDVELWGNA